MKKLIFAILLFLSVFADSYSQQSIRIGAGNIYYIGGDSNYFRFNKQGFFSFGLKTIGTSYMHGQLQFPNADGILLTGGNVTLNDGGNINVNGGGYFLDGVNITTLFPSLSGRNTWTKWNKFDTLGVGSSAYFTFGSSTVTLNNAGFYVGTLGSSDLTVSHELNVTGASITGFNAVKISVDTITAPDEIVNIYGGLNVLAGGYPIFGRTENQNVTFTRHFPDGDLSSYVMGSTGTTISYYDSIANTTTSLKIGQGTITANDSALATRNWVLNNTTGGTTDTNTYVKKYGTFTKEGDLYVTGKTVIGTGTSNGTSDFLVMGDTTTIKGTTLRDSSIFRVMVNPFSQRLKVVVTGKTGTNMLTVDSTLITSALAMTLTGDITTGGNIFAGSNNKVIGWTSRSSIKSGTDGVVSLYNNAETSFDRLTFGGTTSSFPSLKRFGTGLKLMLADTSALTDLTMKQLTAEGLKNSGAVYETSMANYVNLDTISIGVTNAFLTSTGAGLFYLTAGSVPTGKVYYISELGNVDAVNLDGNGRVFSGGASILVVPRGTGLRIIFDGTMWVPQGNY